jgi:prepilin-type N-terminal cleavage/methylation domain-containing protein
MKKSGFTLLELLIVVILMGVVYALVLYPLTHSKTVEKIEMSDFRSLLKPYASKSPAELICYDDCRHCAIFSNRVRTAELSDLHLSSELKTYRYDLMGDFKPIHYPDRLIDDKFQNVCLSFTLYPNGSSTQLFLEEDKDVTFYPTYFGAKREFSTIEEAKGSVYALPIYPTSVDSYYYQE